MELDMEQSKILFFRPAAHFRHGLARQISAPLASADGESTGDPSVASLALALAPWPARRALKVEKFESVSRDAPPSKRCRAGDLEPGLRQSHPRKNNVQSIPYIFPMKHDLLHEIRNLMSRKFIFAPRSRKKRRGLHVRPRRGVSSRLCSGQMGG